MEQPTGIWAAPGRGRSSASKVMQRVNRRRTAAIAALSLALFISDLSENGADHSESPRECGGRIQPPVGADVVGVSGPRAGEKKVHVQKVTHESSSRMALTRSGVIGGASGGATRTGRPNFPARDAPAWARRAGAPTSHPPARMKPCRPDADGGPGEFWCVAVNVSPAESQVPAARSPRASEHSGHGIPEVRASWNSAFGLRTNLNFTSAQIIQLLRE